MGKPESIRATVTEWSSGDGHDKEYHMTKAGPGTAKTSCIAEHCKAKGTRKTLAGSFTTTAAQELRMKGAKNSHTLHSLGMRANRRCVVSNIFQQKAMGIYTDSEAPRTTTLTLEAGKTRLLLIALHPADASLDRWSASETVFDREAVRHLCEEASGVARGDN